MSSSSHSWIRLLAAGALLIALGAVGTASFADDDLDRYMSTTIRGTLTDPRTDQPMSGATVRLISTGEEGYIREGSTDATGAFEITGLKFAEYVMEIETADGDRIQGINALPIEEGKPVEIVLKISDRIASETALVNEPNYFAGVVRRERNAWKRFWREFAIFWGAAAGVGIGVL